MYSSKECLNSLIRAVPLNSTCFNILKPLIEQLLITINTVNYTTILYIRMAIWFSHYVVFLRTLRYTKTKITIVKSVTGSQTEIWTLGFTHAFQSFKIYTGCPRRNVPEFGRVFLILKHTDITQNTYVQIWTVTEIMAREVWNFDSCYTLIDYQIHIKTGRNMWFL